MECGTRTAHPGSDAKGARDGGRGRATRAPFGANAIFDSAQELLRFHGKPGLLALERLCTEFAGLIEGRQKGERYAGRIGGMADGLPQGIDPGVPVAIALPVQVVEFGDRGVAGLEHLNE